MKQYDKPDSTTYLTSLDDNLIHSNLEKPAIEKVTMASNLQIAADTAGIDMFSDIFSETFANDNLFKEPLDGITTLTNVDDVVLPPKDDDLVSSTTSPESSGGGESQILLTNVEPEPEPAPSAAMPVSEQFSLPLQVSATDLYTLTLTDGSVVQLRVQDEDKTMAPLPEATTVADAAWMAPQQPPQTQQDFDNIIQNIMDQNLDQGSSYPSYHGSSQSTCSSTPSSPLPSSAADLLRSPSQKTRLTRKRPLPFHSQPTRKQPKRKSTNYCASSGSSTSGDDQDSESNVDDELLSMFTSVQHITIETLKARLASLPDGQTDLGALLVAAKVDLTVDEIVVPPLTAVKKLMESKGLTDWQTTLCLKIRRRKKNTVSLFFYFSTGEKLFGETARVFFFKYHSTILQ